MQPTGLSLLSRRSARKRTTISFQFSTDPRIHLIGFFISMVQTIPSPVTSSGSQMLVTFTSDYSVVDTGFNASYSLKNETLSSSSPATSTSTATTAVDGSTISTLLSTDPDFTRPTTSGPILDNCQAILAGDSGSFSSPYYPQNYPNNANCSWLITASNKITIVFHEFRTQSSSDVVTIYNGPTTSSSRLLTASGATIPSAVTSSGSQVLITFITDGSVNDVGFDASYSTAERPLRTSVLVSSHRQISLKVIPPTLGVRGSLRRQPGNWKRIQFHFTDFSTKSGDYVQVFGTETCSYPFISQSGNVSSTCGFVSNANSLKINFSSGASTPSTMYPGFRASFTMEHGCDGTFNNTNQGIITSPGFDVNGTFTYRTCSYKLGVDQGSKLNLSVSETTGSPPSMSFYEGYGNSYEVANGQPSSSFYAISRSNEASLYMEYMPSSTISLCMDCYSSYSSCGSLNGVCYNAGVNDGKWKGSYSATNSPTYGCHGSMNTETRTVTSPGYPSTYTQRYLRCNWKIEEPAGKKLQLTFPVSVSLYEYDMLTISNPPWTLTINGGTINPAPVEIGSNETSLYFYTYPSVIYNSSLYSGWKIDWNAISSP